jgi:hypothetical protein
LQFFKTEMLAAAEDFAGPAWINRELIAEAEAVASAQRVVLDMDSTEIPVHNPPERRTVETPQRLGLAGCDRMAEAGRYRRSDARRGFGRGGCDRSPPGCIPRL